MRTSSTLPGNGRDVRWILVGIVLLSIGLRATFAALPRVVRWDEAGHQMVARSLLRGQGYYELVGAPDLNMPPVVSYLSAAGISLGLEPAWATALFAQVLLGGMIPVPVYLLATMLLRGVQSPTRSRRVGLLAALLVAVHPALSVTPLYWSTMSEPPYVFFILCGMVAAWRMAETGKLRWGAATGAIFGLAYLTRPEAMAVLAAMIGFVVLYRWSPLACPACRADDAPHPAPNVRRWSTLGSIALAGVAFLIMASPYVAFLHSVTGRWAFSGKQGISIDIAWAFVTDDQRAHDRAVARLDVAGKEIMWLSTEQYDRGLTQWIAEDPGRFAWQVRRNAEKTWQALFHGSLLRPWQMALVALGLFAWPWTRTRLCRELLLWLALASLAGLWVYFVIDRFLLPAVPICLIWAAIGLYHLATWTRETGQRCLGENLWLRRPVASRLAAALPVVLTLLFFLWGGLQVARQERLRMPFRRIEVAHWLVDHLPPGSPIMTRSSEAALYSDLPMVALPYAEWPQILAYGQARGARYLVVDESEIRDLRPPLNPLLDTADPQPLPGVKFVARLPQGDEATLVYELHYDR